MNSYLLTNLKIDALYIDMNISVVHGRNKYENTCDGCHQNRFRLIYHFLTGLVATCAFILSKSLILLNKAFNLGADFSAVGQTFRIFSNALK